jgi:predicted AlkP superfamily phosphohydrolase/phosphomutase/tetratricopeptide (TPR) repeat protein
MSRRWILAGVILVILFAAGLVHVSPGTWGVLRGATGGRSFVLEPGLRLRIPFFQRLLSYPSGPFRLDLELETRSREGTRVRLSAQFEGRILRETLLGFSDRAGARKGPALVEDDLRSFLGGWAAGLGYDEIPEQPREVRDRFRGAARSNGFEIRSLRVRRLPVSGGGTPPAAGRLRAAPGPKVVLVGIDGADWEIIDPLAAAGRLPTLARLKREGAWANLRTMEPTLSPLLWTTIATGKPPEAHGVLDFLARDPQTGRTVPINSSFRKVKALWNLFTEAGRTCDVVAWWATYPAETVNGTLVSDRVAYSLFAAPDGPPPPGAVFPQGYADQVRKLTVPDTSIGYRDLLPFVKITAGEYEAARRRAAANPRTATRDPVVHLSRILASTRSYHAVVLDLLKRSQPDLLAVYYQGIDEVSHRFAHFADPKMDMVSEEEHRRFRGAVEAFYEYQDRLLRELLSRVEPGSLVLVVSDHGFLHGSGRPPDAPPNIEGQPGRWHRLYGIFVAAGPMVSPGKKETVTPLDIAPTVLFASGLPLAADMPGRAPENLFTASFLASPRPGRIATYEAGAREGGPATVAGGSQGAEAGEQAMIENLRSLGYIAGGPPPEAGAPGGGRPTKETAYSHANLCGIYLHQGKLVEAEREGKRALEIAPGYLLALVYLAETYEQQKRYAEALPLAQRAAASEGPDRNPAIHLLLADLYVAMGRPQEGIADLSRSVARWSNESDLHSALGILKGAAGDPAGAEEEFRKALALNPTTQEPINYLFQLFRTQGDVSKLEPILKAALVKDEQSAFHHNWLGVVNIAAGKSQEAEQEFRKALRYDPEQVEALINLGNLYGLQRKLDEAIPLLKRAVTADPKSVQARVALGTALGIQGRTEESIRTLEEGRSIGLVSPSLYNTLAMAYYQGKDKRKAVELLKESLRLDPRQEAARSLLSDWEKP